MSVSTAIRERAATPPDAVFPPPGGDQALFSQALTSTTLLSATGATPPVSTVLWYDKPASQWIEALPLGNGRLGAMVFGGAAKERIVLNDITVWSGGPQPNANRPDMLVMTGNTGPKWIMTDIEDIN